MVVSVELLGLVDPFVSDIMARVSVLITILDISCVMVDAVLLAMVVLE